MYIRKVVRSKTSISLGLRFRPDKNWAIGHQRLEPGSQDERSVSQNSGQRTHGQTLRWGTRAGLTSSELAYFHCLNNLTASSGFLLQRTASTWTWILIINIYLWKRPYRKIIARRRNTRRSPSLQPEVPFPLPAYMGTLAMYVLTYSTRQKLFFYKTKKKKPIKS